MLTNTTGAWHAALDNGGSDRLVDATVCFLVPACLLAAAAHGVLWRAADMEPRFLRAAAAAAAPGREVVALVAVAALFASPLVLLVVFGVQVGREVRLAGFGVQLTLLGVLTLAVVPFLALHYCRRAGRITPAFTWGAKAGAVVLLSFQIAQMTTAGATGQRDGASQFAEISIVFLAWALLPVIAAMHLASAAEYSENSGGAQPSPAAAGAVVAATGAPSTERKFLRAYCESVLLLAGYAITVFATSADGTRPRALFAIFQLITVCVCMCVCVSECIHTHTHTNTQDVLKRYI
jgi:hypothetical protein